MHVFTTGASQVENSSLKKENCNLCPQNFHLHPKKDIKCTNSTNSAFQVSLYLNKYSIRKNKARFFSCIFYDHNKKILF